MEDLWFADVLLPNGLVGVITGFAKNSKDGDLLYLVEYWNGEGKETVWLDGREISVQ